jgi:hypothetical protein
LTDDLLQEDLESEQQTLQKARKASEQLAKQTLRHA